MIRMIALDVDGTLLNSRGTVTEETALAIQTAREQGVRMVLSTGRSVQEAVWLAKLAGCDERAVCLGGAAIADMTDERHMRRWDISEDAAQAVLETLAGQELACMMFAGETNLLSPYSAEVFRRIYPYPTYMDNMVVVEDPAGWLRTHNQPLTKVYASGAPELFPPLLERLRTVPGLELTSSGPDNFEVLAQGVDKGRALCLLAEEWGIAPGEIAAIGDSDNDLAMLRAVGCPVAMGNASSEVKASAAMVTDSNDQDGAAKAIWKLIEKQAQERG